MNIVLYEPEIAGNAGNIIRTCVCTGTTLHMIYPLGFSMEDRYIKRAGMDYIKYAKIFYYDDYEDYLAKNTGAKKFYFTTKTKRKYSDVKYDSKSHLIFGPESRGIPEKILGENEEFSVTIPMLETEEVRSLNLANSVNIGLYEALRQIGFEF